MMSCSAPCSSFTPSMIMRRVPAPSIFAPILFRKFARSHTSGSAAAPSMTVMPSASTAAIMTLSVPRTVGPNLPRRLITAPFSFGAKTFTLPFSTRTAAPSASKPFRCKSIGRSPMTQPPGSETVASLHRPSSGPEHANRRAHLAHDFVGRDRVRSSPPCTATVPLARSTSRPEMRQDLQHVMGVAQVRDMMEDARFAREQGGGQDRQRRIFRAADFDRAGERMAAVNENFIHTWQRGIVSMPA